MMNLTSFVSDTASASLEFVFTVIGFVAFLGSAAARYLGLMFSATALAMIGCISAGVLLALLVTS